MHLISVLGLSVYIIPARHSGHKFDKFVDSMGASVHLKMTISTHLSLYIPFQVCTGGRGHTHCVAEPVEYTVCWRRQMVGGSQSESGDP